MSAENGTMGGERRLNPLVAGAAVSVMILSLVGIAAVTGMLPGAVSQKSADITPGPVDPKAACPSCGTVESVRAIEVHGETGIPGGVSPASAEKRVVYRVTVRMDDGSFRTVSQATAPAFAVGDKVRVVQGAIRAEKS